MRVCDLTTINNILEAARALSIAATHGNHFVRTKAIDGLHSALIAAEQVRQQMAEKLHADQVAASEVGDEQ